MTKTKGRPSPPPFKITPLPYRFFLQTIYGLAPREIPEAIDELDPLQRGSLWSSG